MVGSNDIRKGRHAVWDLHCHLVFVTKFRHKVFTSTHLDYLQTVMDSVCRDFGAELEKFNGETEHVHLLVRFPATVELSKLVNSLKGVSSRRLRQMFPELSKHYWKANVLWSRSYFAGTTGGAGIGTVKRYIEGQTRPDSPPA
jgi:putative transposase